MSIFLFIVIGLSVFGSLFVRCRQIAVQRAYYVKMERNDVDAT